MLLCAFTFEPARRRIGTSSVAWRWVSVKNIYRKIWSRVYRVMYLAMGYRIEERCLPNAVWVVDRGTFRRVVIGIQCNIRESKYLVHMT